MYVRWILPAAEVSESMSTLIRRTPLRPKRAKPRRKAVTCSIRSCARRPSVLGLCKTHATQRADKLVGDYVKKRDGYCVVVVHGNRPDAMVTGNHAGAIQWAHLISRRYHATRWDPEASVTMCAGHHKFFTERPLEHEEWATFWLGPSAWLKLKRKALDGERPDLEEIIHSFGDGS